MDLHGKMAPRLVNQPKPQIDSFELMKLKAIHTGSSFTSV